MVLCECVCLYSTGVCVTGQWVMFTHLFSKNLMGTGTFARLCQEPPHLKEGEKEWHGEMDTPASYGEEEKERYSP